MTEEQRLADNEIYKRMWRILESKEAGNEMNEEDEEFFKTNLKKIVEYYRKNFYKWNSISKQIRVYDVEVYDFADIMTAEEWNEAVEQGWFNNDDGSGYWVKDGKECKDAEVFSSPQLDATHVAWYNK